MAVKTEILEKTNPEYISNIGDYNLYRQTYLGGSEYIEAGINLFRHGREALTDFRNRLQRAYFENFCAPAIALYAGFLSNSPVNRIIASKSARLQEFMEDATILGQRVSYSAFIAEMIAWAAAQGASIAVVDRPVANAGIETRADEAQAGIRTFVRRIPIENLIDWASDENGNFRWVKIKEASEDDRENFDDPADTALVYRIITKTDWTKYAVRAGEQPIVIAQAEHKLGTVPVVVMRWPCGSLIRDAARINRSVFNHCTLLDEILYRLTFPMLLTPEGKSGAPVPELKIGTMDSLTFDPDNTAAKPEFIATPSGPAEVLMRQIENGITAINRALLYRGSADSTIVQSGIAKAYDFSQLNSVLLQAATNISVAEEAILNLWQAWEGGSFIPARVEYPNTFDLQSLSDLIDNAVKMGAVRMGAAFDKYLKKKIAHSFVDQRDRDTLKEIEDEIDSGATDIQELPPITNFAQVPSGV
jgi:hypothetical protein